MFSLLQRLWHRRKSKRNVTSSERCTQCQPGRAACTRGSSKTGLAGEAAAPGQAGTGSNATHGSVRAAAVLGVGRCALHGAGRAPGAVSAAALGGYRALGGTWGVGSMGSLLRGSDICRSARWPCSTAHTGTWATVLSSPIVIFASRPL